MQVQDHGQVQPTFTRPDIGKVTCPFLVWLIGGEVAVQQVRRDIELVITVCRHPLAGRASFGCPRSWCLLVLITDMPF